MRRLTAAATAMVVASPVLASLLLAQGSAKVSNNADNFIGTFRLVSTEQRDAKGTWSQVPDFNSVGYITYGEQGYMGVNIMPKGRQLFAGATPTPEEAQRAIRGYTGYYGPFTVHEKDSYVIHKRTGKLNPSGPEDYKRFYEFVGNRLHLIPGDDGRPMDQQTRRIVWERVPNATLSAEAKKFVGFRRLLYTDRLVEKDGKSVSHGEKNEARAGSSYIIYTPTGHMMAHLMDKEGRKPWAGATPTPEEALAAYRSYGGYFGHFTTHEGEQPQYVIHHQEGRPNPAPPTDVTRFYELKGNVLRLAPPATKTPAGESSQSHLYWEMLPKRAWK
jgi:hypothetical protein